MENILLLTLFFVYSFLLGFLLHKYLIGRSKTYNLQKANTTGERWEQQSKPIFGGITFYSLFVFSIINYLFLFGGDFFLSATSIALVLIVTISFFMGLADDLLNASPLFKFGMQLAVALILIYFGIYIDLFVDSTLNYLLTIFWVVGIMNSINMLDNMDAVTTSSGLIILLFIGVLIGWNTPENMWYYLTILVGTYASMGSFLIFNWNPSKMYMGDNGSQFLGAVLAAFSILFIWNQPVTSQLHASLFRLVVLLVAFAMPLTDTATVSINRLLRGKSPFVGGKDHTTHYLSYAGLSDRKVAIVYIVGSVISVSLAFVLTRYFPQASLTTLLLFLLWPVAVFSSLYSLTKIIKPTK
ncbi:MAG: MraY family glycosyltransferase [Salinivirgaceae bacterium]|jgi:UDP-GlcNAc:undecaprenyl-phosphate GlcNAc-1-phosphate transferase|nr:MraY family glycosyltransferase [Salinivirgaceae bacterium]